MSMPFEFEKKFITATLLIVLLIFCFVAVFFLLNKNKEPAPLMEQVQKKENSQEAEVENDDLKTVKNEPKEAKIVFVGDIMLDRYIRTVIERKGFDHIVRNVDPVLKNADFVVANLEGPITDQPSVSENSEFESRENYIFTFPKESAQWLMGHNISIVNIGNNHIMNFGQDGLKQTRASLKDAGVKYFGDPKQQNYRWYVKEINGKMIGLVSYNQFVGEAEEKAVADIASVRKKSDIVIVYAHWGEEYETKHNEAQQRIAHNLIDKGADLIIGSHPHVMQEIEEYKGKKIYYSLGNFIFDQYFQEETSRGLLLQILITDKIASINEVEIIMEGRGETKLKNKPSK